MPCMQKAAIRSSTLARKLLRVQCKATTHTQTRLTTELTGAFQTLTGEAIQITWNWADRLAKQMCH